MKLLTITILIASLSVATFANDTANFNTKKEKRINKITERIKKVENRKNCVQNATSLEGIQACKVEKNRDKPVKVKEGQTFQDKQAKIVNRITNRLGKINAHKTCVQNAQNFADLKACKPQKKPKK